MIDNSYTGSSFNNFLLEEGLYEECTAIATQYKLDIKVKTDDVGVRTGMNSSRIPGISVIDGQAWKSYRRDKSAIIEDSLMLASCRSSKPRRRADWEGLHRQSERVFMYGYP
jgi:hypothetical protein